MSFYRDRVYPALVDRLGNPPPIQALRRTLISQARGTVLEVEFLSLPGERVPLGDASVDTVVSTFTLCTIPAVREAVNSLARVLKQGGALLFLENSVANDIRVRRWQERWQPVHHRVFDGLFLTRDIPVLIASAGFRIEQLNAVYLSRFPKSWSHCSWGTAIRS